jgi:beta-glucanase (GH16 family)
MKTFTLCAVLIAGLFISGLYSCKKLATVPPVKQTPPPTNPKTATTQCDYDFSDTALTSHGWTKAFDDEFTGDLSNWYAYTNGVQNELQYYQPANVQIVGGVLQLSVKQETVNGTSYNGSPQTFNYTSGSVVSNQTFSANATTPRVRIVTRAKVAAGYGLTSVFESYGTDWPTNGQINYFQVEGNDTKEYVTNYFYGTQSGKNLVQNGIYFNPTDQDLSACWHVYMTEWSQNSINYYLDGQLVETKTAGGQVPGLFGKQENLAINLPVGGLYYQDLNTANIQTGTMYVDYVKVFTSN